MRLFVSIIYSQAMSSIPPPPNPKIPLINLCLKRESVSHCRNQCQIEICIAACIYNDQWLHAEMNLKSTTTNRFKSLFWLTNSLWNLGLEGGGGGGWCTWVLLAWLDCQWHWSFKHNGWQLRWPLYCIVVLFLCWLQGGMGAALLTQPENAYKVLKNSWM